MGINSHLNKTQPWEGSIEIHVLITIPFPLLLYGRYEAWTKRCFIGKLTDLNSIPDFGNM